QPAGRGCRLSKIRPWRVRFTVRSKWASRSRSISMRQLPPFWPISIAKRWRVSCVTGRRAKRRLKARRKPGRRPRGGGRVPELRLPAEACDEYRRPCRRFLARTVFLAADARIPAAACRDQRDLRHAGAVAGRRSRLSAAHLDG